MVPASARLLTSRWFALYSVSVCDVIFGGAPVATQRPRIGVVGATRTDRERDSFRAYVEAVEAAGGEAVPVLPGAAPSRVLDDLDGVVLTGGPDVAPEAYGEATRPEMSVEADPERDALELPLAREAVRRDLPVFAICRGIQTLNVALGGTLIQDVDVERTGRQQWSHQQRQSQPEAPLHAALHEIAIAPGTRLREIAGADTLGVNTFHHQALKEVAPELVVTARSVEAQDAPLIEAVEAPRRRFVVGVQWHPERMWRQDPTCARLFRALVRAAAEATRGGAPSSPAGGTGSPQRSVAPGPRIG